jgi:membrane-anchored mycosin MYCP
MRVLAAAVLVAAAAIGLPATAAAAPPVGACRGDPDPGGAVVTQLPWAQQLLDLNRTSPHSTGAGVTVAVVDSGVDADHPQLQGKVLPGADFFLVGDLPGNFDCISHGTAGASIIAASPVAGVGFRGVAPDARILPVRIADRELTDAGAVASLNPVIVADGIRYAADSGAKVINLSMSGYGDFPAVREAVAYAQSRDALVVAAVGNQDTEGSIPEAPSFPASYDGVIGVGGITIDGVRAEGSQVGPYVDLMAPGEAVLAASRVAGHQYASGTSFAAPFVSGVAALVRAAYPHLTAPQVAERLLATADPAPGGKSSLEYGAGIVDPYRAVTEDLSDREPLVAPAVVPKPPNPDELREAAWWADTSAGAKIGAGLVVAAILVAVILAVALPRARRRRWVATRRAELPDTPGRLETPDQIFLFPTGPRTH